MKSPTASRLLHGFLFALAFVVYSLAWRSAPLIATDTAGYVDAARALREGRLDQIQFRTPGYPLLLIATDSTQRPTRALYYVSLLLHLASVYLLAGVLTSSGVRPALAIAGVILMLLPPYVQPAAMALSETLTTFCLALGFAAVHHYMRSHRWFVLAIASFGFAYAALTRPTYQLVAFAVALMLARVALSRQHAWAAVKTALKEALILVSGSVILVGGYSYFNYVRFGAFSMSPAAGYVLVTRTVSLYGDFADERVRDPLVAARNSAYATGGNPASAIFHVQSELMAELKMTELELGNYLGKLSLRAIRRHPEIYLEDVARSFVEFWFPASSNLPLVGSARAMWYGLHYAIVASFALSVVVFAGLTVVSAITRSSTWLVQDARLRATWWIATGIVFYTAVITCLLAAVETRYRTPVDVFIIAITMLAFEALVRLREGAERLQT